MATRKPTVQPEQGVERDDARDQELEQLRAQLEQSEKDRQRAVDEAVTRALSQQTGQQRTDRDKVTVDMSDLSQADRREKYSEWPTRGGSELPQPWDLRAQGLLGELRDYERDSQPGSPNTVSPIVVNHGVPILAVGSSDPSVHTLGRILGGLGFPNSVSEGTNAYGHVDNSVMGAVHAFRDAYGVQEDPSAWGGDTPVGRSSAAAHIGPWTAEAILRAGQRELEPA